MIEMAKKKGFVATLSIGKGQGGIPVDEFCALIAIATKRYGNKVMMAAQDEKGHAHLTLEGKHIGYIDIDTGSLVWDAA